MTAARRSHRSFRWLRLALPYTLLLTVLLGSAIAYSSQQPDLTDRDYLSPTSTGAFGGDRLARLLSERGVRVRRETRTSQALVNASAGQITLFIPAPALVHPYYLRMIKLLPASTRVLLVAPRADVLDLGHVPAVVTGTRLAARAVEPGCGYAPAVQAGAASVYRLRYDNDQAIERCYGGGLTVVRRGATSVTLVGSDEPFRNDRIGEHHNAALATGLLSATSEVIWLDLHRPEKQPGYVDDPALAGQQPAPPSLGPGSPDPEFEIPDSAGPDEDETDQPEDDSDDGSASAPNPLWQAFPPWVFAVVALTALAVILIALARARRLGAPIPEPLPIVVRTTETVEGRGRLYQRARARGPAASALREGCRQRLTRLLDLDSDQGPAALVPAVAMASGWTPDAVEQVLYGEDPADDQGLVRVAMETEALLRAVTRSGPPPAAPPPASPPPAAYPDVSEGDSR